MPKKPVKPAISSALQLGRAVAWPQTPEQARLALRGLHAAWTESAGRRPQLVGGRSATGEDGVFGSAQQVAEAIRDPRYKRDPAYRAEVQARLARSNVFGRR